MRKFLLAVVLLTVFAGGVTVPSVVRAQATSSIEEQYRAALLQLIDLLQKQLSALQAELVETRSVVTDTPVETEFKPVVTPHPHLNEATAAYTVADTLVKTPLMREVTVLGGYVADPETGNFYIAEALPSAYFNRVLSLFPTAYAGAIGQFVVFDGKETEYDAFVETLPPRHDAWVYAAHEDMLADPTSAVNTELIVHELAHVVGYDEIAGVPRPTTQTCVDYFDHHGCPLANSYLSVFVDRFWSAADLDRAETFATGESSSVEYYKTHKSAYVSDYAASGPEEDFAESFMYFVLGKESRGEAAEKVAFFGTYPALRTLRADVIAAK